MPECTRDQGMARVKSLDWITVHRAIGFDPSVSLDAADRRNIDALNAEMIAAGIRVFVCGLQPVATARSVRLMGDGGVVTEDGPPGAANGYIDGFWVLSCRDMDQALEWGHKAAWASRAAVEVRPFY